MPQPIATQLTVEHEKLKARLATAEKQHTQLATQLEEAQCGREDTVGVHLGCVGWCTATRQMCAHPCVPTTCAHHRPQEERAAAMQVMTALEQELMALHQTLQQYADNDPQKHAAIGMWW